MALPIASVRKLWDRTGGKAWEPPKPNSEGVLQLIAEGWVRRCDMRCMYEKFKDTGLTWTECAKAYFALEESKKAALAAADKTYWDNMDRC